ncbi:hypothetical protein EOA46_27515 [Mesorhizobium sp. M1A.F.Ca.IN.022.05.2.1]|nr:MULTISPECIES: hypothetical protein [unclassified Mesorhizobium]RUV80226.1 hypothetical protein EOA51_33155 [Mesorhizobium sp. M1A.F.Ca.IN.020.32.1.1]RUW05838.1 hypothetical protein EOA46_27515 [Mesorhizobium sp. M1A.F.Ca.IN.022.05.2.1]RWG93271.1 MAG: hypothetical protein EOQ73_32720 [Mesorhizobium sp.]
MLRLVKSRGEEDETSLQGGLKPRRTCSKALQGRDAIRGVVKSLGEEDETLLQGGLKPRHTCSEAS